MNQQHGALLKAKVAGSDAPRRLKKSKCVTKLVCYTHTHVYIHVDVQQSQPIVGTNIALVMSSL